MTASNTDKIEFPYAYADGILDTAREEVSGGYANASNAFFAGKITEEQKDELKSRIRQDYIKVGKIPYAELEALIQKYAEFDRTGIYIYPGFTLDCNY